MGEHCMRRKSLLQSFRSLQGRAVEVDVVSKSQFRQVIEHALYRKWGAEKLPKEGSTTTVQPEGLEYLIETVGRLEAKLNTVADHVQKLTK